MRIKWNETSKGRCYYIIRSVYKNGKNTSEIVERIGYPDEIREKYHCDNYMKWMQDHLADLREEESEESSKKILVPYDANSLISKGEQQSFNVGYLFLQKIYYQLRIDLICNRICKLNSFQYDLNAILSSIVFGRILFPGSKLSTWQQSKDFLESPEFEYHQIGRALSVLASEFSNIQAELYQYSKDVVPRKTGVLYYDCTNFYFEIDEEDDISNERCDQEDIVARKYGHSKEHRPCPIVQMGLFMDYSGIPLAMNISRGNRNEQTTLIPLEQKILSDFETSKFVVCTDSGLSSDDNRKFNNWGERSYVTAIPIKKMNEDMQKWALSPLGWKKIGDDTDKSYDISSLEKTEEEAKANHEATFYKEQLIQEYDNERDIPFTHSIIIIYSLKYRDFLRYKRDGQIRRAMEAIKGGQSKMDKKSQNDFRRFVKRTATDAKGKSVRIEYSLNEEAILEEEKYDGFYAVDTNLLDDIEDILNVARGRWEIEESFRIMKEEFRSRPVFLSRQERIKAHFLTCFISLLIYRILERKLDQKYTCDNIISTLRSMRVTKAKDIGFVPSYTRSDITDDLHEMAGFRTDYEIIRTKAMKGVVRKSKLR